MPKERMHLLLAGQSLEVLTSLLGSPPLSRDQKFVYSLGAISPDALFYDLPTFRLSAAGESLHRLEGTSCLRFFESIRRDRHEDLTPERLAWILGVATHFLADGIWHPLIRKLSDPATSFCRAFRYSRRQCHHGLESELEAYWLARIGPEDGYLPLLRQFMARNERHEEAIKGLRMILMRLGLNEIPEEGMIDRCFFWQASLLRLFSQAALARQRKLFLRSSPTRYLGALIVPLAARSSPFSRSSDDRERPFDDPWDETFMARSVMSIAEHLKAFLVKHYPDYENRISRSKISNQ
jgi:hypothetical protein